MSALALETAIDVKAPAAAKIAVAIKSLRMMLTPSSRHCAVTNALNVKSS
jgi:hypothetical protein